MMGHREHRSTIAIVGNSGGTNVGDSLRRAALALGHEVLFFNSYDAWKGNRLSRAISWRLNDRRPLRLDRFSTDVVAMCSRIRPTAVITTGSAPLNTGAVQALSRLEISCFNYSTDDPWNPSQRAQWFIDTLPFYRMILTTRRANIGDFRRIGCQYVQYLPFGYDEEIFGESTCTPAETGHDVLFVGGADRERISFVGEFMSQGQEMALVGDYWERATRTRRFALGHKPADEVRMLTVSAKVNLCLVRRANRDGHVMRSFEIAALGGCMLTEDTEEHREIFGTDGDAVVYFRTAQEAAARARSLLADPSERDRLSKAVRARITRGAHSYRDRLISMLYVTRATHLNRGNPETGSRDISTD